MSLHEAEIAVSKYCTFANAFDHLHYVKPARLCRFYKGDSRLKEHKN